MSAYPKYYVNGASLHSLLVDACRSLIILVLLTFIASNAFCQPNHGFIPTVNYNASDSTIVSNDPDDEFEEIIITLNVQRIGSLEIPALIYGHTVYLSVTELFDFLKIRNVAQPDFSAVSGFFINPQNQYLIEKANTKITYQGKTWLVKPNDIINTPTALYLNADYLGQIFGLVCSFDFRSLTVNMTTKQDLPAIREMQMALMHRNMNQLKGERKADTTIKRNFTLFHIGMADWSVMSTQISKSRSNSRVNLGIGAVVAGGELNLSLNYNSDYALKPREQYYQWRYVNNDHAALRQITAGKIFAPSLSSLYAPVTGLQLTNTPSTYRKSFGTYTLSNTTEPEWTVELYVNNVLVNYAKADASGFYTFEVPVVYGNSVVKLRFYGPWGEERTSEKYISIPFNFIPFRHLEYNVTAGVVNNNQHGLYSRGVLNYGLSRRITIGGGVEYLSTVTSGKFMPFVNASLSLGQHFLVSAEHSYGVRTKGIVSYRTTSNLQVDLSYSRYAKNQTAVLNNNLDEKKLVISMPVRVRRFTAFSRFTFNQFTMPDTYLNFKKLKTRSTSAELLISAVVGNVSSNFTTYAVFTKPNIRIVYSNLSVNFRLPAGFRLTPQAQYEYGRKQFSMLKVEVEKSIFNRGFLNLSYEKDFIYNMIRVNAVTLGFRYNFNFAQTYFSVRQSAHLVATTQSARGSLLYDDKIKYLALSTQSSVGKGGIIVSPFLDMNCNGLRDEGEPKVPGLNLRVYGGHQQKDDRDTIIHITGLEAYSVCILELDKNSFDNVSWQIKKAIISVTVEPNNFKMVEVPISVVGEASGNVMINNILGKIGIGRIIINIFNSAHVLISRTLSEEDGYFSVMGLPPGNYTAMIDTEQLKKLQLTTTDAVDFEITAGKEGDVEDGIKFTLSKVKKGQ